MGLVVARRTQIGSLRDLLADVSLRSSDRVHASQHFIRRACVEFVVNFADTLAVSSRGLGNRLIQVSRKILLDEQATRLTDRDRQLFAEMLDDESTKPNAALVKAAKRYKKQVG